MTVCLVTGAAGYIGRRLVNAIAESAAFQKIIALDVQPLQQASLPDLVFIQADIRDRQLKGRLADLKPHTVVHLAFVVNPMRNEQLMFDINVNGTLNILEICGELEIKHLIILSSATAYGARPDNPLFISEEYPIQPHRAFSYPYHKGLLELYFKDFIQQNPQIKVSIVRPVIIYGPGVNNYLSRYWQKLPFIPLVNGLNPPFQFVHED
ncbi:MAG: NAD-dependent epimerase/dehydratase family protein, partial [Bacillota bacterium]